ncbi:hypothetical protein [Flavobacterium limi]|uniref:PH domain-containing protein n=1 Tax=Flavobacterium limi TaxID=2045105 RepID=A0ABQ1ULL6_9FLAO|nr:hypothetical protein [Flavobacterium limi]GGF22063.1 hypothetical protein GCM10011518_34030 [Flavobacterium limi]
MKNTIEKHFDGINIHSTLKINSSKIGKIVLAIFLIIFLGVLSLVLSTLEKDEIASAIIPVLIISAIIIIFPLRYLIWNIYGKEVLIVNSKSISYYYDYGFFKTNFKTILFTRLGTQIEFVREYDGIENGRLIFYNYREIDDLPEEIHRTSILIDIVTLEVINCEITELFESNNFLFSNN